MKIISKISKIAIVAALIFGATSCSDDDDNFVNTPTANIVLTATADTDLSILVAALGAADGDLVSILNGTGPFTILAPTNSAFEAFLATNDYASLDVVPKDILQQVLLNHVIPGEFTSTDLTSNGSGYAATASTAGSGGTSISSYYNATNGVIFNGGATNGGATVTAADIKATNGIIHKVDAVIALPKTSTFIVADANLGTLEDALITSELVDAVDAINPVTVFAPTDDAFGKLTNVPVGDELANVLQYHVVGAANIREADLQDGTVKTIFDMQDLTIDATAKTVKGATNENASTITATDIQATNGVIHTIDQVLLPATN